jgi:hypothetical protein
MMPPDNIDPRDRLTCMQGSQVQFYTSSTDTIHSDQTSRISPQQSTEFVWNVPTETFGASSMFSGSNYCGCFLGFEK